MREYCVKENSINSIIKFIRKKKPSQKPYLQGFIKMGDTGFEPVTSRV